MSWDCAARTEIINSLDDAAAKHHFPRAIDCDAREERIVGRGEPSSQAEAISRCGRRQWRQYGKRVRRNLLAMLIVSSAFQNVSRLRLGHFFHDFDLGNRIDETALLAANHVQFRGELASRRI